MLDSALFSPTAAQLQKAANPPAALASKEGGSAVSRDLQEAYVGWLTSILAMPTSAAYKYAFLTDTLVRSHNTHHTTPSCSFIFTGSESCSSVGAGARGDAA
jgi:hypothetical protein